MQVQLKVYDCLCETESFSINGIAADWEDFGVKYDANRDNAEEYGCGNMQFSPEPATSVVLAKYGITVDEYNIIANRLKTELSFGRCGVFDKRPLLRARPR